MNIRIQSGGDISHDPVKSIAWQPFAGHPLTHIRERPKRWSVADFKICAGLGTKPAPSRFRKTSLAKGQPIIVDLVQGRDHVPPVATDQHTGARRQSF